jgi:hypothetical protein
MFGVNALVRETVVTFLASRGEGLPRLRRAEVFKPTEPSGEEVIGD